MWSSIIIRFAKLYEVFIPIESLAYFPKFPQQNQCIYHDVISLYVAKRQKIKGKNFQHIKKIKII